MIATTKSSSPKQPFSRRLEALQVSDEAAAVDLLVAAFADYPAFLYLNGSAAAVQRFLRFYFARWIPLVRDVPGAYVLGAWCDAAEKKESRTLVGVSLVLPPTSASSSSLGFVDVPLTALLKNGFCEIPFRFGLPSLVRILRLLVAQETLLRGLFRDFAPLQGRPFYYQDYLAIAPAYQGQGWGQWILEQQEQVLPNYGTIRPVVLNTYAPAARQFYRRFGFVQLGWHVNGRVVWWFAYDKSGNTNAKETNTESTTSRWNNALKGNLVTPPGCRLGEPTPEDLQVVERGSRSGLEQLAWGMVSLVLYPLIFVPALVVCTLWRWVSP